MSKYCGIDDDPSCGSLPESAYTRTPTDTSQQQVEAAYREGYRDGYGNGLNDGHPLSTVNLKKADKEEQEAWEASDANQLRNNSGE